MCAVVPLIFGVCNSETVTVTTLKSCARKRLVKIVTD
jgi:hypothetical protein